MVMINFGSYILFNIMSSKNVTSPWLQFRYFLKNFIQYHTYAKFHSQDLTASGFMMEAFRAIILGYLM